MTLDDALAACPAIAILRGLRPDEALAVGQALFDAGLRAAEVPLNSLEPFTSIALLQQAFGDRMAIGAGTVRTAAELQQLAATGAQLAVSPHTDSALIAEALRLGLTPVPGFQTATEAFAALAAGARWLKLFPATGREADLQALRAVLPPEARVLAVGGTGPEQAPAWLQAGAAGLGVGGELFRPGFNAAEVGERAGRLVAGLRPPVLLAKVQAGIGESPIWCEADARIRWVDPLQQRLLSCAADGSAVRTEALPRAVWSLGLRGVELVGSSDSGFCRLGAGFLDGPPAAQAAGCRFNDMAVDAQGGLWAGSMHKGLLAGRGTLWFATDALSPPRCVAEGLGVPNGMGFNADGSRLYVIDTLARTLLAYPIHGPGQLGEPQVLSDFLAQPGKPDGMCVAPDGTLWVAMWGGSCLLQLAPDGAPLRRLSLPTAHISSCCPLPDGRLAVSTSTMRLSPAQRAAQPLAGALFALSP
jgi:Entner-Doudoroff aldolase